MKRIIIQIIIFLGIIGSFSCDQSDIWGNGNNPLDKTPPFLSSVVSLSNTSVEVTFSEDVDESSAEEVSNYTIPDLAVLSAERNVADNSIVTLTTSSQEVQEYTITVANVEDLNSNIIGSPNSMVFTGKPLLPEVVDVVSISNTDVKITFSKELEQTSAETAANYSITDIASVVLDVNNADQHYSDKTIVYLTTDAQSGVSYSLSVINVQDNSGNMIDPDNSFSFAGNGDIAPEVRSVIATSNTSIRVVYSEDVEQATAEDIDNYTIVDTNLSSLSVLDAVLDASDNSIVDLTTDSQDETNYSLTISDVQDTTGNTVDPEISYVFSGDALPYLVEVASTSSTSVQITFSENVEQTSAEDIYNYDIPELTISSASLFSGSGNVVDLTTSIQANAEYTLTVTNVQDVNGNTIGAPDSMEFFSDLLPEITSVESTSNTNVLVTFSEDVEQTSAETVSNYSIDGLTISGATQYLGNTVNLTTDSQSEGQTYTLTVNNVQDSTGNSILPDSTATFTGKAPVIDVSPAGDHDFGTVEISSSKNLDITITNNGSADLTIDNIIIEDDDADFSISCCSLPCTIAGSDSIVFTVIFNPQDFGEKLTDITIINNDIDVIFNVMGFGDEPEIDTVSSTPNITDDMDIAVNGDNIYAVYKTYDEGDGDLWFVKSTNRGIEWVSDIIVDSGNTQNTGRYNSIAVLNDRGLDGDDIYICYYDEDDTRLMIAKSINGGGVFSIIPVINDGSDRYFHSSIAAIAGEVPDNDTVYISYQDYDSSPRSLSIIKSTDGGGNWQSPVEVDKGTNSVGLYSSIAVVDREQDTIYISYYDETSRDLKFAKSLDGGATWLGNPDITSIVDWNNDVGQYSSIAVISEDEHSKDAIYISYYDDSNDNLMFAKSIDGGESWLGASTIDNIVALGSVGQYSSIAVDDNKVIYISYYDSSNQELEFAKSIDGGTSWSITSSGDPVDPSIDDVGKGSSIAVEGSNVYIIYQDETNETLKYAKSIDSGKNWLP